MITTSPFSRDGRRGDRIALFQPVQVMEEFSLVCEKGTFIFLP
jgi:hypothetical protein